MWGLFSYCLPDFMYPSICIFIWLFEDIQMAICVLIPTYCRAADKREEKKILREVGEIQMLQRDREEEADLQKKWESARLREVGGVGTHTDQQSCHILYKALSFFLSYRPIINAFCFLSVCFCFAFVRLTFVQYHIPHNSQNPHFSFLWS